VLGGLAGCICIATGLIFFVGKRKLKHSSQRVSGARWVDALAVASVTGVLVATLSMLVANRLLPVDLAERDSWEEGAFFGAWLLALGHALWRSAPVQQARVAPAWREQCWVVVALAVAAVGSNWLTTGDHLMKTIASGYWPVAGFDLALLFAALVALLSALKLRRVEQVASSLSVSGLGAPDDPVEISTGAVHG
jgi:hypothetical protein